MNKKLQEKFDKLKNLIETDTEKALEFFPELQEAVYEDIEELKDDINDLNQEIADLESAQENLSEVESELEELQETLPKNLYEEQKDEVVKRLMKNLSLEQLENLEQTVKNTFAAKKKNYILELP